MDKLEHISDNYVSYYYKNINCKQVSVIKLTNCNKLYLI